MIIHFLLTLLNMSENLIHFGVHLEGIKRDIRGDMTDEELINLCRVFNQDLSKFIDISGQGIILSRYIINESDYNISENKIDFLVTHIDKLLLFITKNPKSFILE